MCTRVIVQLLKPPAKMPRLAMPWMFKSVRFTLLDANAAMPCEAQLPNGGVVRLQATDGVVWNSMQLERSVISRHETFTFELPRRLITQLERSLPHSCGGALQPMFQPAPRICVGCAAVPLGIGGI